MASLKPLLFVWWRKNNFIAQFNLLFLDSVSWVHTWRRLLSNLKTLDAEVKCENIYFIASGFCVVYNHFQVSPGWKKRNGFYVLFKKNFLRVKKDCVSDIQLVRCVLLLQFKTLALKHKVVVWWDHLISVCVVEYGNIAPINTEKHYHSVSLNQRCFEQQ